MRPRDRGEHERGGTAVAESGHMRDDVRHPSPGAVGGPYPDATIAELAPLIAAGTLRAEDLLDACLERIDCHDRAGLALHALISRNPNARADARALDVSRPLHGVKGPLHGIPLVIKDNIDMLPLPTTSGCVALAAAVPKRTAPIVTALRQAGAVIVAKTNMSELSLEIRSRSSIAGDVRNPFRRFVTAGGSSGGTAAAIAAGFALAGLGTDTGGSIRIPAAFNGLAALRPTQSRFAMRGIAPLAPSADTVGPMAKSVADLAVLAAVMDPTIRPPGRGLGGVRIGVLRQAFGGDPDIAQAIEAALGAAGDAGAALCDPLDLPHAALPINDCYAVDREFAPAFDRYLSENFAAHSVPASFADIARSGMHLADHRAKLRRYAALPTPADDARQRALTAHRNVLCRALDQSFADGKLVALAYPSSMIIPDSLDNPRSGWAAELAAWSGRPALTLPVGLSATGVPIGLEFLGRHDGEGDLLDLGMAVERLLGRRYRPVLTTPHGHAPNGPASPAA